MTTTDGHVTGELVHIGDDPWYRIDGVERMEPFLTTVVSDGDLWMFVSSAGPLTAGRMDADHALWPYETDDRLHRMAGRSGPVTMLTRRVDGRRELWQPFARRPASGCTRSIAKHELGNALTFEEVNPAWGLTVRATWQPSRAYGWVRTVELVDTGPSAATGADIEVLDGFLDVMPAGVDAVTEQLRSNLVDAYKRAETGDWGTLAIYSMESLITDRAEPAEALAASVVWSVGLDDAEIHLDERVVDAVWCGQDAAPQPLVTGRRGAYLLRGHIAVPPGGRSSWMFVADTGLGHARLQDLLPVVTSGHARDAVAADIEDGRHRLAGLLLPADARQRTADPIADAHHLSNVLFNSMRGGVFPDGYHLPVDDLIDLLRHRNRAVHERYAHELSARGASMHRDELLELAERAGDPDLLRLALEHLPLTFSRRHGDPSRPWNRFSIRVVDEDGSEVLGYEGNWRDIFQNWEALLRSYPRYLPGAVARFVNASTVDGHNPYRISRDGIDWEEPDPDDPWSNIGYWGDHQVVYLLRLLERWQETDPDGIDRWLDRPLFTYADVPYRIAGHDAMLRDPRDTIAFDDDRAAEVAARVAHLGGDGRLVVAGDDLVRVTLAEKLLVPALAKLSAYVAGGGIWMNTQRPEWNDANNALAGYGLSMVTLYHLESYLTFLDATLTDTGRGSFALSRPIATWLRAIAGGLAAHDPATAVADPGARRTLLDVLARAGEAHRTLVADGFDTTAVEVDADEVRRLLADALAHLRASVRVGRRRDGLFHAYNLVSFPTPDTAQVHELPLMLEGQVAVLGTSDLDAASAAELVESLFDSPLYRPDQASFLLYPVEPRPSFLARNRLPDEVVSRHPELRRLTESGIDHVLEQDASGGLHFRAGLTNADVLADALDARGVDASVRATVLDVYEHLFDHHAFTGRSGAMYGYEGIGSVYWHMVAKLLLAVQERYLEVADDPAATTVADRLAAVYRRVRDGLGFRKDPATYGAFPTDCYSHTPAHAGAQQPGMTGQVKEEVLARSGELGVVFADGRVSLGRALLPDAELLRADDGALSYDLTVCGTPVRVVRGDAEQVAVTRADGDVEVRAGRSLTGEQSAELFDRRGTIAAVEFVVRSPAMGGAL